MNIFKKLRLRFYIKRLAGTLLLSFAISLLLGSALYHLFYADTGTLLLISLSVFALSLIFAHLAQSLSRPKYIEIARYLDRNYSFMEDSATLLLRDPKNSFERWQREKIELALNRYRNSIQTPVKNLLQKTGFSIALFALSALLISTANLESQSVATQTADMFSGEMAADQSFHIPDGEIAINPPAYTGFSVEQKEIENITAPEFSQLEWTFPALNNIQSVTLTFRDRSKLQLQKNDRIFQGSMKLRNHHIYQVEMITDKDTVRSDFLGITADFDDAPTYSVTEPVQSRTAIDVNQRDLDIRVTIMDDYSVEEVALNATLARGTGENVRFRERTIPFDELAGLGSETVRASVLLNAGSLEMKPGDELYFFVSATDNHPEQQQSRSDTFFFVYPDTSSGSQPQFARLMVDLMPDYFRSQRQIIIDTEQLLEDKPRISQEEFEMRSASIGHDQNVLRLRYGHYLGLEDEQGMQLTDSGEDHGHAHGHQHEENHLQDDEADDLNEQGQEKDASLAAQLIPEEFMHDHGSPEMNTLYADDPRAMLKESLDNMWNAELYLRTNRPSEALPFEYRALELLKAVQHANRQFVRKVGYDLPPIPEDEKRLTGIFNDFAGPGTDLTSEDQPDPLSIFETMTREGRLSNETELTLAKDQINRATIGRGDQLILLNRIREIENNGLNESIRTQILELLNSLDREHFRDPAPRRYPSLQAQSGVDE